mmetsp:Transcript_6692/g.15751  ORF Transcript_6692/g.15751 Transcript_6692/m.15751 type:complete len:217 (-) Transcript_6692:2107-2757(-)
MRCAKDAATTTGLGVRIQFCQFHIDLLAEVSQNVLLPHEVPIGAQEGNDQGNQGHDAKENAARYDRDVVVRIWARPTSAFLEGIDLYQIQRACADQHQTLHADEDSTLQTRSQANSHTFLEGWTRFLGTVLGSSEKAEVIVIEPSHHQERDDDQKASRQYDNRSFTARGAHKHGADDRCKESSGHRSKINKELYQTLNIDVWRTWNKDDNVESFEP